VGMGVGLSMGVNFDVRVGQGVGGVWCGVVWV